MENMEHLRLATGGAELTDAESRTLEWIAGWEDSTVKNVCTILYKARNAEQARALERDSLTRKDLLTIWGYLDVLTGYYNAKAHAAATRGDDTGDKLTADYTRRVEEIRSMQRKINREAREE